MQHRGEFPSHRLPVGPWCFSPAAMLYKRNAMTPPFQREASLLSVLFWHSYQVRPEPGGAAGVGGDCSTDLLEKVLSLIWGGGSWAGRDPSGDIRGISTPLQDPCVHLWLLPIPPLSIIPAYREVWAVRSVQMSYPIIFLSALGAYLKPFPGMLLFRGENMFQSSPDTEYQPTHQHVFLRPGPQRCRCFKALSQP